MAPPFCCSPDDGGTGFFSRSCGLASGSGKIPVQPAAGEEDQRDPRGLDMAPPFCCCCSDDGGGTGLFSHSSRLASGSGKLPGQPAAGEEDKRDPRALDMEPPSSDDSGTCPKALMKAAMDGNLSRLKGIVKSLAKLNGDLSTIFSFSTGGANVLHIAAYGGHLEVCKYLVEELGGDGNAPGYGALAQGSTPFMMSAQSGDIPTFKYFLDHGGDLMKTDDQGRTVLHHAVGKGSCKVTEFILSEGVPVDLDCGHGTPLYMAATNEQEKTLKILLDHHANRNIITSGVGVPLLGAVISRSWICMRLLIKAGADVNCEGSTITPLAFATMHGNYTNYIKLLLKAGADPNIPDDVGRLPIEYAALRDCMEEVEMLLPVTTPIPNASFWSIDGVISYAKNEDKKEIEHLERRIASFKSQADTAFKQESLQYDDMKISRMTSERKDKGQMDASVRNFLHDLQHGKRLYSQNPTLCCVWSIQDACFCDFTKYCTEAVSKASRKLGVIISDYYIVHLKRVLELDDTVQSQDVQSGSRLILRGRLRGGVSAPQRMTFYHPFIDYTHSFGDELFDLCYIPKQSLRHVTVCLDQPGTLICSQLTLMIYRLFHNGRCAPVFSSTDVVFDSSTGCLRFRPDFEGYEDITDDGFASSMRCLGYLVRRTFYFAPARVQQGLPVIRVLVHGEDTTQVSGQLPDYVFYLVTDLMDVRQIVMGATVEELLEYFISHITLLTSNRRIAYLLNSALHIKCYRGGIGAFAEFMTDLKYPWTSGMTAPLTKVRGFEDLMGEVDKIVSLAYFSVHTRNFISHPNVHKMSEKQAEALVMLQASECVHQLSIDLSLRIPVRTRIRGAGGLHVPVVVPNQGVNQYVSNGYNTKQIVGRM